MDGAIARARSERGELVLLRRGDAVELRVNGVFVMDTAHTGTERELAAATLRAVEGTDLRVLVGGLGLGFTLQEVLADPRVREAHVVEIEPDLLDWHRAGLVPQTAGVLRDDRVRCHVGDVAEVITAQPAGSVDVLLLDVDNGPGYLVLDANAAIYRAGFLARCAEKLSDGGTLAIWSADTSPELRAALEEVFGGCEERAIPVRLGRRETTYHLFLAVR
ncbi:spermidine synthase [Saccharopolyspora hordei]|uniref:Spermidine synthase n=1 Tax=Saccharopolyspora hordei TaxID=1838 RepID=A0A853ARA5_9PSEU|nr:hypothetical protein [Saccharopolyspora hordei]NYI83671.1 spermidine synthase [Saccharopolyspora hordei]